MTSSFVHVIEHVQGSRASAFCVVIRDRGLHVVRLVLGKRWRWLRLPEAAQVDSPARCTMRVSYGDDERPSRVTGRDLADGVGCSAQRVGAADDRPDLSGLDQFLQGNQVG